MRIISQLQFGLGRKRTLEKTYQRLMVPVSLGENEPWIKYKNSILCISMTQNCKL